MSMEDTQAELEAMLERGAQEFEAEPPRPLMRDMPEPLPYPTDSLGSLMGPAAEANRARVQAPPALSGQSTFAAANLAVQAHGDVRLPHGEVKPCSENFVAVAESGERKTTTDGIPMTPIKEYEKGLNDRYKADHAHYLNTLEAWKQSRSVIAKKKTDAETKTSELDQLGEEPHAPLSPMMLASEPTYEGLVKNLQVGLPSIGIFTDEGGQLLGGYAFKDEHRLKTAAGLSGLWDGGEIRRIRAGDGASVMYGKRVCMHVMVQPTVAPLLLADDQLIGQGLVNRILPCQPSSTIGTRFWNEEERNAPRHLAALDRFNSVLRSLLETPLPLRPGTQNELQPRILEMAPDVSALWTRFSDHLEREQRPGGDLELIRGFASKAAEHAARLAATRALIDTGNISMEDMEAGIELIQFYTSEVVRLHEAACVNPDLVRAQKVLDWLLASWEEPLVSAPDIYQGGPRPIRDAATAKKMIAVLEKHGWLNRVEGSARVGGAFRREVWAVVRPR